MARKAQRNPLTRLRVPVDDTPHVNTASYRLPHLRRRPPDEDLLPPVRGELAGSVRVRGAARRPVQEQGNQRLQEENEGSLRLPLRRARLTRRALRKPVGNEHLTFP